VTRIGIISDVHADVDALADALTAAKQLGCDLVVCAGDVVDYGPFPEETIIVLRKYGVRSISGNHDAWAAQRGQDDRGRILSRAAMRFLRALPACWNETIDDVRVAVHHGRPGSYLDGIFTDLAGADDVARWLREANADVLIVGHTHQHFAIQSLGGGLVVNPGSVLRNPPISGLPATGTFGVLDLPSLRFAVYPVSGGPEIEIERRSAGIRDSRHRIVLG